MATPIGGLALERSIDVAGIRRKAGGGCRARTLATGETGAMAFGQQPGPPATARQVRQLTELVVAAGHADFRDARGPLGLNQRQAGGRFTREEADDLIARLEAEAEVEREGDADTVAPRDPGLAVSEARVDRRAAQQRQVLTGMPAEVLAAELQRRGWVVLEP